MPREDAPATAPKPPPWMDDDEERLQAMLKRKAAWAQYCRENLSPLVRSMPYVRSVHEDEIVDFLIKNADEFSEALLPFVNASK